MKKQQGTAKPFFTQFLESQEKEESQLSVEEQQRLAGKGTLKYPSDKDESIGTQKYPSDADEGDPAINRH